MPVRRRALRGDRCQAPYVVGFYLVPVFPLMAFAAAIEPLRSANRLRGDQLYEWRLYSRDGGPVRASNGVDIAVHAAADEDTAALDLLLACAGTRDAGKGDAAVAKWLRALASPSHYYLKLRLDRARSMLLQTTKPVLDVAVACGFASASHFSCCYRSEFGHRPRDERVTAVATSPPRGRGR